MGLKSSCSKKSAVLCVQLVVLLSKPVLKNSSVLVSVACPAVDVVTVDDESNLVVSDQLVCPLPPTQSVCVQGELVARTLAGRKVFSKISIKHRSIEKARLILGLIAVFIKIIESVMSNPNENVIPSKLVIYPPSRRIHA